MQNMKDWAVILGSSSGFGAATCREIASKGINIYGIHLDRKAAMEPINSLVNELKNHRPNAFSDERYAF